MADTKVSDLPALNGVDVDPADLLYIVDSSAGAAGSKKITVGQYQVAPYSAGTANGVMYLNGSNVVTTGSDLVFNATGLGIGTSSPGYKLDVNGQARLGGSTGLVFGVGTAFVAGQAEVYSVSTTPMGIGTTGAAALRMYTNSVLAATLDASGNLGLGVTPSAWSGYGTPVLELKSGGTIVSAGNGATLGSNWYYSGGQFRYTAAAAASYYFQSGGAHQWYTAPSGTAGNAISFTQAMTLDASGNLVVGKTTAEYTAKLSVKGTGASAAPTNLADLSGALMLVESNKAGTGFGGVGYVDSGGGGAAVVFGRGNSYDTQILFCTNPSSTTTAGAMTERVRITSGGSFCVGQTTPGNENSRGFYSDTAGYFGQNHLNTDASGSFYAYFGFNGGTIGSITQSGTTAVLYNTTSDQRLKTNIVDAPDASALIDAIQVRSFDWIADDSHQRYGMVAQELAQVAPEAVHQPADHDEMMAVDYSKLVPMLIKEIQSLRARVAALEAQ